MGGMMDGIGGEEVSIKTADLVRAHQTRVVDSVNRVEGYSPGDPQRLKFRLVDDESAIGNVLYSNGTIDNYLSGELARGNLPNIGAEDVYGWRGLKLGLYAAEIRTKTGNVTARQVKILGWDESLKGSAPGADFGTDRPVSGGFDPAAADDDIPF